MKSFRLTVVAALAALVLSTSFIGTSAIAQDKMGGKMDDKMDHKMGGKMDDKMGGKMDHMGSKMAGPVYVSKMSKMGFTPSQASKMAMKDMAGHKLVKMSKLPVGYKMAPSKMGDKMGKMDDKMDHKMGGKMDHKMGGKMDDKMGGKMDDKMGGKP